MENTSNENIAAALKLLEEAAKQKKDDLKAVMADKFTHLRSLIIGSETCLLKSLNAAKEQALAAATHAREVSVAKAREIGHEVDQNVHQNPWPYIAGTAVVGVLLGFILGRSRK